MPTRVPPGDDIPLLTKTLDSLLTDVKSPSILKKSKVIDVIDGPTTTPTVSAAARGMRLKRLSRDDFSVNYNHQSLTGPTRSLTTTRPNWGTWTASESSQNNERRLPPPTLSGGKTDERGRSVPAPPRQTVISRLDQLLEEAGGWDFGEDTGQKEIAAVGVEKKSVEDIVSGGGEVRRPSAPAVLAITSAVSSKEGVDEGQRGRLATEARLAARAARSASRARGGLARSKSKVRDVGVDGEEVKVPLMAVSPASSAAAPAAEQPNAEIPLSLTDRRHPSTGNALPPPVQTSFSGSPHAVPALESPSAARASPLIFFSRIQKASAGLESSTPILPEPGLMTAGTSPSIVPPPLAMERVPSTLSNDSGAYMVPPPPKPAPTAPLPPVPGEAAGGMVQSVLQSLWRPLKKSFAAVSGVAATGEGIAGDAADAADAADAGDAGDIVAEHGKGEDEERGRTEGDIGKLNCTAVGEGFTAVCVRSFFYVLDSAEAVIGSSDH
ncbi:hypothetical protein HDU67_000594 [Dinochytrium kinnereticum]|nr:hypothetical protein HDU67_000594 [Dinochytrium kinnereticum]